jgi:hypothetical protein
MTEDKIKAIGKITLTNSSLIGGLAGCLARLIEQLLAAAPDQPGVIALLHELEQLQACISDLQPSLDLAGKEIDGPDS